MPGKINPTQCEALSQVCVQVFAQETAISFAASQGQLQLNVYKPLIIFNYLTAVKLLADAITNFVKYCLKDIRVNEKQITKNVERSLMLATALTPHVGYDCASAIAKIAHEKNITLREAALRLSEWRWRRW